MPTLVFHMNNYNVVIPAQVDIHLGTSVTMDPGSETGLTGFYLNFMDWFRRSYPTLSRSIC